MRKFMTYHVVDSIKGGSGKTTFSIMLAEYLWKRIEKDAVCLFDMDFVGTGLWNLFYTERGGDYLQNLEKFRSEHRFINDVIRHFPRDEKKYIDHLHVAGCPYNIAFGSPVQEDKDEYIFAAMQNYTMALQYGSLKAGLCNMLSQNSIKEQIEPDVEHIILDMAPCNDNYSQVIKQVLFDRGENLITKNEDQINYYLLVGMDQSHVVTAANYLRSFLSKDDKLPDKFFVIFNDVAKYLSYSTPSGADVAKYPSYSTLSSADKNYYQFRKDIFCDILDIDSCISQEKRNNIYFLALNEFQAYAKLMLEMQLLNGTTENIFLETPFSQCATFDGEMVDNLPKLRAGEDRTKEEEYAWEWISSAKKS